MSAVSSNISVFAWHAFSKDCREPNRASIAAHASRRASTHATWPPSQAAIRAVPPRLDESFSSTFTSMSARTHLACPRPAAVRSAMPPFVLTSTPAAAPTSIRVRRHNSLPL
eukprot:scaffold152546_cov31-Tisochrysis_lutea.AAC.3